VARPNAVKKASANARELIRKQEEQRERQQGGEQNNGSQQQVQQDPPPVTSEQAPDLSEYLGSGQPAGDQQQDPPTPSPSGDQGFQAEIDRLTQANRVLKGKYDAEVPRLQQQIRDLEQQLEAEKKAGPTSNADLDKIREALLDELPESSVESIMALASRGNSSASSQSEVKSLQQRLARVEAATFEEKLTDLVPNWRVVDADPRFTEQFLHKLEGNTGREKGVYYMDAYRAGDAVRCAAFLKEFEREIGAHKAPPPDAPRGAGDSVHQQQTGSAPMLRRSELQRIEKAAAQGKYKGKEQQLAEVRRRFRLAAAEGRLINDVHQG